MRKPLKSSYATQSHATKQLSKPTCPIWVLMATLDRGCAAAHMLAYSCCRASSSSLRCRLRRNRPTYSSSKTCEHSHLSRDVWRMAACCKLAGNMCNAVSSCQWTDQGSRHDNRCRRGGAEAVLENCFMGQCGGLSQSRMVGPSFAVTVRH